MGFGDDQKDRSAENGNGTGEIGLKSQKKDNTIPRERKWSFFWGKFMWLCLDLLELNDFLDEFWNGMRFQVFFYVGIVCFEKLPELIRDLDNKCACTFEQQRDPGHLPQNVGAETVNNPWFLEDFEISLDGTV